MKKAMILISVLMLSLTGCGTDDPSSSRPDTSETLQTQAAQTQTSETQTLQSQDIDEAEEKAAYHQISQEEAKRMMEADDGHVIVDVRRQDEYDSGHIPGAILIPNESIDTEMPSELPDKEQVILVYCRSGRRSKEASEKLADMGYTNIYEFGGIIDWTGETVTGDE